MAAPGRWGVGGGHGRGDQAAGGGGVGGGGTCYLPGRAKPGEATPGLGGGKAEARFRAGLKDAHKLQTPCPLPILQTTWGAGGLWVQHVQRFTSKTKSQVVAWL